MADLNSYDEVTQLSEDMTYPEGYNVVEIVGSGDSRQSRIWPTVKISGPVDITSDGVTVAEFKIDIYDPNADNPFYLEPNQFEQANLNSPQDMELSYWVTRVHGVWTGQDRATATRVPDEYVTFTENKIILRDGWKATPGQDWDGFYLQEAWVEYDGQYTVDVEDGNQVTVKWWILPGDDERRTEKDVEGLLYIDLAATQECSSSIVPIPNIMGQNATAYVYYRPEGGESGTAYVNAAYDGTPATATIVVYAGAGMANITLNLEADPGTIGLYETSNLIVVATYSSGNPVLSGEGSFYVYIGGGYIINPDATFGEKADETQTVYTSVNTETDLRTEFSLSYPVVRIKSITAIGGGWTWNGQVSIDGSTCNLVDDEFPEDTIPIEVVYDWGGYANAMYKPGGADAIDSKIYCGFKYNGHNALCEITIGENSSSDTGDLSINAEDTSLAYNESTTVILTAVNSDGTAADGTSATVSIVVEDPAITCSISPPTVVFGTKALTDQEGTINSLYTFTIDYLPVWGSIKNIEFLGETYTVKAITDYTVTINEEFPTTTGTLTCDYTAKGYGETTFTAPGVDATVYLVARWSDADPQTETITVDASGTDSSGSLQLDAEESSLEWGQGTTITVSATNEDGTPGAGVVVLSNIGGSTPASVTLGTLPITEEGSITGFQTFSISYPTSVGSITSIEFLGSTYTAASVDGTEVTIVENFPVVSGSVNVSYTAEGIAAAGFTAPSSTTTCYVTGLWSTADAQTITIDVTEPEDDDTDEDGETYGTPSISLSVSPSDLDIKAGSTSTVSTVTVNCEDAYGNEVYSGIRYSLSPANHGGTWNAPFKMWDGETESYFLQGSYAAGSWVGTVTINAAYSQTIDGKTLSTQDTQTISITDTTEPPEPPEPPEITLEDASAAPETIKPGESSTVGVTLKTDGTGYSGRSIKFEVNEPWTITSSAMTDSFGRATVTFTTKAEDKPGTADIAMKYTTSDGENLSEQVSVTIEAETVETDTAEISVSGTAAPSKKLTDGLTGGGCILKWGAADDADEFWCVPYNPTKVPDQADMIVHIDITGYVPAGGKLTGISVSGAEWSPPTSAITNGEVNWSAIPCVDASVPWNSEANTALEQKIYVGDKADPSVPVIGANVTIAGQSKVTDDKGFATFAALAEGEHDVIITHPNYLANYEDTDTQNDKITINPYSKNPYRLNATSISISVSLTYEKPKPKTTPTTGGA